MKRIVLTILATTVALSAATTRKHNLLATGSNKSIIINPKDEIIWQGKAGNNSDIWMLKNGNILFADGSVKEMDKDGNVVWQYKSEITKGGGAYSCQPLPKNKVLVSENSTGRILEVDKKTNKITFQIQTKFKTKNNHQRLRMARKLRNGNYLVCQSGDNTVKEFDRKGKLIWDIKVKGLAFAAARLKNGNTMVSTLNQITEYNRKKEIIWEFKTSDLPELKIRNMTGFQFLPNGNVIIGCYSAYNKGEGVGMFEITRKKKLAWKYAYPGKGDRSHMGLMLLDPRIKTPIR